jgi:hypothetical protein
MSPSLKRLMSQVVRNVDRLIVRYGQMSVEKIDGSAFACSGVRPRMVPVSESMETSFWIRIVVWFATLAGNQWW